jgi:hypothetical protein
MEFLIIFASNTPGRISGTSEPEDLTCPCLSLILRFSGVEWSPKFEWAPMAEFHDLRCWARA